MLDTQRESAAGQGDTCHAHSSVVIFSSPTACTLGAEVNPFVRHLAPAPLVLLLLLGLVLIPSNVLSDFSRFRIELSRELSTHFVLYPVLIQIAGVSLIPVIARRIRRWRRSSATGSALRADIRRGLKQTPDQPVGGAKLSRPQTRLLLCGMFRAWRSGRAGLMDASAWRRFRARHGGVPVLVFADPEDDRSRALVREAICAKLHEPVEEEALGIPIPGWRPYVILIAYAAIIGALAYLGNAAFSGAYVNTTNRPPVAGLVGIGSVSLMLALGWHALRTYNGLPFELDSTFMIPGGVGRHSILGSRQFLRHRDIMAISGRDDRRSFAVKIENPETGHSIRLALGPEQTRKLVAIWLAATPTSAPTSDCFSTAHNAG